MWQKIGACLLLAAAVLGLLVCVICGLGVWVANGPLTDGVTAALVTAGGYVQLTGASLAAASDQVEGTRQQVDALQSTLANLPLEARAAAAAEIKDKIAPPVNAVRATVAAVSTAAVALNKSLESANRIPGVNLPTFTEQLQAADQALDEITNDLATATAQLADVSVDGSKAAAVLAATSNKLAGVESKLDGLALQSAEVDQALIAAEAATPPLIDWTSVALSLLFLLFGAGQLCLMTTAIQLLRARAVVGRLARQSAFS